MEYYCYIRLKPYIREWLESIYGSPVKFKKHSMENAELKRWLRPAPEGHIPQTRKEGEVAIVIPNYGTRPASVYHYMNKQARLAIFSMIENNFYSDLKMSIRKSVCNGVSLINALRAYMEDHHISIDHEETLRQNINRTIMFYKKHNLDFYHFDAKAERQVIKNKYDI